MPMPEMDLKEHFAPKFWYNSPTVNGLDALAAIFTQYFQC
jgi:hypothetical protein